MTKTGDTINSRWELVDELSTDTGQGNTFLGIDSLNADDTARYVVKLLKVENPRALMRFEKEIRACFALKHRNIVKVKDSAYKDAPTPHAHREGVIHRDIKPGNIFLEDSDSLIPIVGDFGLCFFKDDKNSERETATGESIGNWEFGPPEGHMGRQDSPDYSFDVYTLGRLLYWLLSGGVTLYREYFDRPQFDLRKASAAHAVHLAYEVMTKSVTEDPTRRYATAAKMYEDVKELVVFVENDGRYLDCALPQSCVFCRVGNYNWQFLGAQDNDRFQFAEYGLSFHEPQVVVYPRVLFGNCGRCGNIQQFRLDDRVKRSSEWKNVPPSPHSLI